MAPRFPDQGLFRVWVAEAVPLAAGCGEHGTRHCLLRLAITGHQQPPAEHADPLIELVAGV
jgi:hypothetical protein